MKTKTIKLTYSITVAENTDAGRAEEWLWRVIRDADTELPKDIFMIKMLPEILEETN